MAARSTFPSVQARVPRWSVAETRALFEAWEPLHQRRRQAQGDPWVPPHQRRSSLDLVDEDWRAVAVAVNNESRAAPAGRRAHRTPEQCKTRMNYLKICYIRELSKKKPSSWRFFSVVGPAFARAMPLKMAKVEPVAREVGETSGAAEERGSREAAAGSTNAGAGGSVAAVLTRVADMCERVMIKWLEVQEAEKAAKDQP